MPLATLEITPPTDQEIAASLAGQPVQHVTDMVEYHGIQMDPAEAARSETIPLSLGSVAGQARVGSRVTPEVGGLSLGEQLAAEMDGILRGIDHDSTSMADRQDRFSGDNSDAEGLRFIRPQPTQAQKRGFDVVRHRAPETLRSRVGVFVTGLLHRLPIGTPQAATGRHQAGRHRGTSPRIAFA